MRLPVSNPVQWGLHGTGQSALPERHVFALGKVLRQACANAACKRLALIVSTTMMA